MSPAELFNSSVTSKVVIQPAVQRPILGKDGVVEIDTRAGVCSGADTETVYVPPCWLPLTDDNLIPPSVPQNPQKNKSHTVFIVADHVGYSL